MNAEAWRVQLEAPRSLAPLLGELLEAHCSAVVCLGDDEEPNWQLQGICTERPDEAKLRLDLAKAARRYGLKSLKHRLSPLEERDWAAESLARFQPIRVGRFYVRGTHVAEPTPNGCLGIIIDAAAAFGSGEHGSTKGCLLAFHQLAQAPISNVLDLGCGSAVLAIAAAKLWGRPVVAADVDARSLEVARANVARNGVKEHVHCVLSDGYGASALVASGPYDLICANILAGPLVAMAQELANNLAPGGHAVLAGFLARDADWVGQSHLACGLRDVARIAVDDWVTLILRK